MSINDVIEKLEQVTLSISSINARIENLEGKLDSQAERGDIENHEDPTLQNFQSNLGPNNAGHIDINSEYQAIKSSVQSLKLPQELTVPTDRSGVKKTDLPVFNIISKSARIAETGLKVLQRPVDTNRYEDLFNVLVTLIKFLQEEQAALVVQASFDPTVSRFFRTLQRGANFSEESLQNLRAAASIASVYRPTFNQNPNQRGGYRNSAGGRDVFSHAGQFSRFPSFRGGRGFRGGYNNNNFNNASNNE